MFLGLLDLLDGASIKGNGFPIRLYLSNFLALKCVNPSLMVAFFGHLFLKCWISQKSDQHIVNTLI